MAKRALTYDTSVDSQPQTKKSEPTTPSKISTPDGHATVEAAVMSLSPQKTNSTFFDGELTDGKTVIRLVGFDRQQHTTLKNFFQKAIPIRLNNCAIQRNKLSGKLEVNIKGYTVIEKSTTTFHMEKLATLGSHEIPLIRLQEIDDYEKVTVKIKVLKVLDPETVGKNKTKQEVYVADATAVANVTIWEDDVNTFTPGCSYQLNRFSVRSYRGKKHLSYPPTGASYEQIDDIGDVMDESDDLDSNDTTIEDVKVIGVYQLESIYSCIGCKKGTIEVNENQQLGTCKLCKMDQVPHLGKLTAKLFLETFICESHVTVRAYKDMLNAIVQPQEITTANLIQSPRFDAKYNEFHVLTSVSRK